MPFRLRWTRSLVATAAALAACAAARAQICNNTASCLAVHPTPGCNSFDCCNLVCGIDPSCCGVGGWDASCVVTANQNCVGYPGAAASGSCFSAHSNPNCDSATCCTAVCAFDPFCCNVAWDVSCAAVAGFACPGTPGQCGSPAAGSCTSAHPQGACSDATCCNAVCSVDPSCCSSSWDELCVVIATEVCVAGCEPVSEPNAQLESEACGARTNDPCYTTTGGAPQVIQPGLQVAGRLGTEGGTNAPVDVDVYTVTLPDPDGDGLVQARITFASAAKAWAALLPNQGCFPMSAAILQVASELCVDQNSLQTCIPAGTYRLVVSGGVFPQFGGASILCGSTNKYTLKVTASQTCGNPCANASGSCFIPASSRGCGTAQCCSAVCAADSFCCDQSWDASCVELAGTLCLSGPPANDLCANATLLGLGSQTFNTLRSGLEGKPNQATCSGATFARDIWFRWTSDRNGDVTVQTCNPWFDTLLGVYTGACGAQTLVACNDNASNCGGIGSRVTFAATCGTTYFVRVGPRTGGGGEATITLSSSAPVCATCPGDLNGDRQVNAQDLAALLGAWGLPAGDLNNDGTTNAADLSTLLSGWGPCP